MDLIKYFKMGFQKYADFSTRSTRSEFWWFQLGYFLIMIPLFLLVGLFSFLAMDLSNAGEAEMGNPIPIIIIVGIGVLFIFGTIIPQIAITVRRLHDAGQSGWMYLLTMVPYVGSIAWIIFGVLESQPRENRWGPVPGSEEESTLKGALVDFGDDLV